MYYISLLTVYPLLSHYIPLDPPPPLLYTYTLPQFQNQWTLCFLDSVFFNTPNRTHHSKLFIKMYYQNKSKTYFIVFVLIFAVFIQQLDSRRIGKKYFRSAREIRHNSVDQSIGCKAKPTASMYQFLNRICEDCFNVYRDTDLYHMCRYVLKKNWIFPPN